MAEVRSVVLVHGAWVNGSRRSKVIALLEKRSLQATAIQLPITSLKKDVATVRRAIALE